MRILIAVHGYPPTHHGGAELRAARTAVGLKARGHSVHVLCVESAVAPHAGLAWQDRNQDGVGVRRVEFNYRQSGDPFRWSYTNPQIGLAVRQAIDEWSPQVVHLFSGYLLTSSVVTAAKDMGLPVVVSLTDYWWLCQRTNLLRTNGRRCDGPTPHDCARCHAEMYRRFRWPAQLWPDAADRFWKLAEGRPALSSLLGVPQQVERATTLVETLRRADMLIAPSRYLAEFYVRHGIAFERMRIWRQGVDPDGTIRRIPSPELRVGYFGQIKRHKGVDLLLEAWRRLQGDRPRHLHLFGSDAGEEAYGRQIRTAVQQLDHVTWTGAFQRDQVWQVLSGLDVLVVPSRWVENSPNTILEAQAAGVPIVGSNLGGVAELVQHGRNGLVFEPDDAHGLASQLQRLLDDSQLLECLRRQAIPCKSVDDEIDEIDRLYAELVFPAPLPVPATRAEL